MKNFLNLSRIYNPIVLILLAICLTLVLLTSLIGLRLAAVRHHYSFLVIPSMILIILLALNRPGNRWWLSFGRGHRFLKLQKYSEAAAQFRVGLEKQNFEAEDPRRILLQEGLALAQRGLGDYVDAEQTARAAAGDAERIWGERHNQAMRVWNTWGLCLLDLARFAEAESVFRKGAQWAERGNKVRPLATWLNNVAVALTGQKKYAQAEEMYRRALEVHARKFGPAHFLTGFSLMNLAFIHIRLGNYVQAEAFARQCLEIFRKRLPTRDLHQSLGRGNLALAIFHQGRLDEAEHIFRAAMALSQEVLGPEHPLHARPIHGLVLVLKAKQNWAEAETLCQRELRLRQEYLVPTHPDLAETVESYADLLRQTGRAAEAADLLHQHRQGEVRFENYLATAIQSGQRIPLECRVQKAT